MSEHSRREFMIRSAAASISVVGAQKLFTEEAHAAEKAADMAVARWTGPKQTPAQIQRAAIRLTEKAIEGVGGLKRFLSRGDVVWVKPNIAWDRTPELAGNTNPDVVATVVRLCFEAGAKTVKVGDNPCNVAASTYKNSGIAEAARSAGAEVLFLDTERFRETAVRGERFQSFLLCPEILDCDLVVNVPIVKHHNLPGATLCMKNLMGVMDGRRNRYHQALADMLTDLTRFMKPRISIMDAVRILTKHGPRGGDPADVELKMTVAAGVDIVAMDAFGAELLDRKPDQIESIVKGQAAGLGRMDYRSLAFREIAVS